MAQEDECGREMFVLIRWGHRAADALAVPLSQLDVGADADEATNEAAADWRSTCSAPPTRTDHGHPGRPHPPHGPRRPRRHRQIHDQRSRRAIHHGLRRRAGRRRHLGTQKPTRSAQSKHDLRTHDRMPSSSPTPWSSSTSTASPNPTPATTSSPSPWATSWAPAHRSPVRHHRPAQNSGVRSSSSPPPAPPRPTRRCARSSRWSCPARRSRSSSPSPKAPEPWSPLPVRPPDRRLEQPPPRPPPCPRGM
jgi:Calcium binding